MITDNYSIDETCRFNKHESARPQNVRFTLLTGLEKELYLFAYTVKMPK